MSYWLLKTEPGEYSYDDLSRDRRVRWDGVSNALALIHMRAARPHDEALIYHTGIEKRIVGLVEIVTDPYPAPGADEPRQVVFDVKPKRRLPKPIPLAAIKADPDFNAFALVRNSRLSVMPVEPVLWDRLLAMGGLESAH